MQEGGFACYGIELTDRPDPDQPKGPISHRKFWPADLASELERHFAAEFSEGHGTEAHLGRLRITVEAVK
jgi:hypothetical protein